jgi:hypothetical protein
MTEGKMGYEDFVYFILSEEDKSSEPSLEYWYAHFENYFYCLDCDIRSFQLKFLMGGGGGAPCLPKPGHLTYVVKASMEVVSFNFWTRTLYVHTTYSLRPKISAHLTF